MAVLPSINLWEFKKVETGFHNDFIVVIVWRHTHTHTVNSSLIDFFWW